MAVFSLAYKTLTRLLKKMGIGYDSKLKSTARVRTGALRNSIKSRVVKGEMITKMLSYGLEARNWTSGKSPLSVLREETKAYSPKLAKAFAEDVKIQIKNFK